MRGRTCSWNRKWFGTIRDRYRKRVVKRFLEEWAEARSWRPVYFTKEFGQPQIGKGVKCVEDMSPLVRDLCYKTIWHPWNIWILTFDMIRFCPRKPMMVGWGVDWGGEWRRLSVRSYDGPFPGPAPGISPQQDVIWTLLHIITIFLELISPESYADLAW